MIPENIEVLHQGDEFGNNMIIKTALASGREIYGFTTKNNYGGGWDLGPTWNYVITSEKPFLLDAGRRGTGLKLLEMLEHAGLSYSDLDFILLSHGHEDHDGGLNEIINSRGEIKILAHETYSYLKRSYPDIAPSPEKKEYTASCWHCRMPEPHIKKFCRDYHKEKIWLKTEEIKEQEYCLADGITLFHVPGHSPDAIALLIDDEALFTGDTILSDITPHPTAEKYFDLTQNILPVGYSEAQQLYGLRAYIRSLKKLNRLGEKTQDIRVLPAHRLFYDNKWNHIDLKQRVRELIDHHIQRCSAILDILKDGPKTPEEITTLHFNSKLLKGYGIFMGINEIFSHLELLECSGDIIFIEDEKISATREGHFESLINKLE